MASCLLDGELKDDSGAGTTSVHFCLVTFFELCGTHQQLSRHDDLRDERLCHMFSRMIPSIGVCGTEGLFNVTQGGKTNVNGNIVATGAIRSRNPLFGVIFARACLMIYRWLCEGEPFPDLLDPDSYFRTAIICKYRNPCESVSYSSSYELHKRLHLQFDVHPNKVLHQGRREGQEALDNAGGYELEREIKRMAYAVHTEQAPHSTPPPSPIAHPSPTHRPPVAHPS